MEYIAAALLSGPVLSVLVCAAGEFRNFTKHVCERTNGRKCAACCTPVRLRGGNGGAAITRSHLNLPVL